MSVFGRIRNLFRKKKEFPFRPQQVTVYLQCPENSLPRGKMVRRGVLVCYSPDGTVRVRFGPQRAKNAGEAIRELIAKGCIPKKVSVIAVYEKEFR